MNQFTQPVLLSGKPAAPGIGIGQARILKSETTGVSPETIGPESITENLKKYEKASSFLLQEYEMLKSSTGDRDAKDILDAQIQILQDPELEKTIRRQIKQERYSMEYAVFNTFNDYIRLFQSSSVRWANDRVIDVVSIRDELIDAAREKKKVIRVKPNEIVFAEDISPAVMVKISRTEIAGIVIERGGLTSHVVILSQSLGIPCVINARWNRYELKKGASVIIDGTAGQVILNPTADQKETYRQRKGDEVLRFKKALDWVLSPNETRCGSSFTLRANVEFLEELPKVNEYMAEGIGLLRTETILFESENFDVVKQMKFYSTLLEQTGDHPVTIRLFDAGGDKLLEDSVRESNPFLGWRGVRMLLDKKDLLRKQLEAVYRVSALFPGRIRILIPMVSRTEEIERVREVCDEVQRNLKKQSLQPDGKIPLGIMIEVPSAVLVADQAAALCDFFSIGTNDLTQYTFAVDRGNERVSELFDSFHPAIWKLIKMTKEAADRAEIPLTICGEMASRPEAAACFVGLGITDLSMNSASIPKVKSVLCRHTLAEMQKLAADVTATGEIQEIHKLLTKWRF